MNIIPRNSLQHRGSPRIETVSRLRYDIALQTFVNPCFVRQVPAFATCHTFSMETTLLCQQNITSHYCYVNGDASIVLIWICSGLVYIPTANLYSIVLHMPKECKKCSCKCMRPFTLHTTEVAWPGPVERVEREFRAEGLATSKPSTDRLVGAESNCWGRDTQGIPHKWASNKRQYYVQWVHFSPCLAPKHSVALLLMWQGHWHMCKRSMYN